MRAVTVDPLDDPAGQPMRDPPSAVDEAPATGAERLGEPSAPPDTLEPGDLVDKGFRRAPCELEHDAEVFGVLRHEAPVGAPYPGNQAANAYQEERCSKVFAEYVGIGFGPSELGGTIFGPNGTEWRKGERRFVCAADRDGKPLVGTVRDSRR